MKTFNVSVSIDAYPNKPIDTELNEMLFTNRELDVKKLSELIVNGHSTCHVFNRKNFLSTHKSNKNFKEANIIVLDFDHSPLNLQYVLNNLLIKPSIAFETLSNQHNDFRFKLIFLLDNPINDAQEYNRMTEMVFNIIFNEIDKATIKESLDSTCYRVNQMFYGTNHSKQIEVSDTIISVDLINQTIQNKSNEFQTYEDVYNYLNIPLDFKPEPNSKTNKNSTGKIKSKGLKKCPKKRKTRIIPIHTQDLSCFPIYGTVKNELFDMGINNEVYFIKSPYNNYHTISINDNQYDKVYYYVGNQNIYAVNTYFVGGKQKKGFRKKTLQYTALVFRNLYPEITETDLFKRLKDFVIKYVEQPGDLTNDWIRRLAHSTMNMTEPNNAGKKYYVLNPAFNYLSKSDKMKELHKVRSEMMTHYILNGYDSELSMNQNAELLQLHPKTVKKYLDNEGVLFDRIDVRFERFCEIYSNEENKGLSVRKFAELCGISKSQAQRYIKKVS